MFEKYIRPQVEYYITVIRLFAIKTATIIVILLSLQAKMHRVCSVSQCLLATLSLALTTCFHHLVLEKLSPTVFSDVPQASVLHSSSSIVHRLLFQRCKNNKACRFVLLSHVIELTGLVSDLRLKCTKN